MRRVVVLVVVLAALASSVGTAWAGRYYLTIPQAQHETRELVKSVCGKIHDCVGYGAGKCHRNTGSNVSCIGGLFYEGAASGEEEECNRVVRWGVNSQGYIAFRGYGPLHCFTT